MMDIDLAIIGHAGLFVTISHIELCRACDSFSLILCDNSAQGLDIPTR